MRVCEGWHKLNVDAVVNQFFKEKNGKAEELVKRLKDLAEVKTDTPSSSDSITKAFDDAIAKAQQRAEAWCRKQECGVGDCDNIDFKFKATFFEDSSLTWTVQISITEVECACRDTNTIIIHPKNEEHPKALRLKSLMDDAGLTQEQVKKVDTSNCNLYTSKKTKLVPKEDHKEIVVETLADCAQVPKKNCPEGKKCTLVMYEIGVANDQGSVQKTPYDISSLPAGYYIVCECR